MDHMDDVMALNNRIASLENFENINRIKLTPLQRFYTGSNLFITGGTGMTRIIDVNDFRICFFA